MADMDTIREQVAVKRARRAAATAALDERLEKVIGDMPASMLRRVLRLYVDEIGYLGDHMPDERENTKRFACSGETYHRCSFGLAHQQGCKAIGGDGSLVGADLKHARSCEADCDASAPDEPWCQNAGFDCPTCAMVDELLGLLAAIELPAPQHPGHLLP